MRRFRVKFKAGYGRNEGWLSADAREGKDARRILMLASIFLK